MCLWEDFFMPKYRAIEYLRLSKEKKGEQNESNSITNQKKIIEEFVKYHPDIQIVDAKVDDGFTGTNFDRPGFQQLLREMEEKTINCIIVKDLSRFGRDYIECGRYIEREFAIAKIRFIAVVDGIDTLDGNGYANSLMIPVKNLMNDLYSSDISAKIRSSNDALRRNGEYIGSFPVYGYQKSEALKHKLIIDEYPASIVRYIFSQRIKGRSYSSIANELNKRGIQSPMAYKKTAGIRLKTSFSHAEKSDWSAQSIKRIVTNKIYTGCLQQKKQTTLNHKLRKRIMLPESDWICCENTHEAIIDPQTFEAANNKQNKPIQNSNNFYGGLVFCANCGKEMKYHTSIIDKKRYESYRCLSCHGRERVSIPKEKLDNTVLKTLNIYINTFITDLDTLAKGTDLETLAAVQNMQLKNQIDKLEKNERKLELRIAGVSEDYIAGIIDKAEAEEYRNIYEKRLTDLICDKNALKASSSCFINDVQKTREKLDRFLTFHEINQLDRELAVLLIAKIIISDKKIKITFNWKDEFENFYSILKTAKEAK